ncbi:FAD-linked oxidoreductase [Auriscalpium vulgare]|uniref:FAD-linked oxidoreductase n=1 Tax=Auriscalpium vulgare TaxID=40419 RepID=A0ACB8R4W0_9AGAM|nr:FAD-linked oxidoreductase [Auriscalpium vulgare]
MLHLARRVPPFSLPARPIRFLATGSTRPLSRTTTRRVRLVSGGVIGGSLLVGYGFSAVYADVAPPARTREHERSPVPLIKLIRSYVVYTMCSVPALVDYSPSILEFLTSIPGIKQITEAFVRVTFFGHFVGGDTAQACVPLLRELRTENKGALLAYSVEVDEHEAAGKERKIREPVHKRIVQEMLRSIDVAADFEDQYAPAAGASAGRRTWVAIKLSALLPDAEALRHFSAHLLQFPPYHSPSVPFPGSPQRTDLDVLASGKTAHGSPLMPQDLVDLKDLYADLRRICMRAKERNVRVIIDAEYTWYQPAIDSLSLALMREFNALPEPSWWSFKRPALPPLVYVTFQAYLRRTPEYLLRSLQDAQSGNYALGIKLVRGAYHEQEALVHPHPPALSPAPHPPVWATKPETDRCYDASARALVLALRTTPAHVGVLFGTHNRSSCGVILDELVRQGLARREIEGDAEVVRVREDVAERATIAQLYGMSDALTNHLVETTRSSAPFVIKYVPYGALSEVMPYLSRRAIENKSVLGNGQAAEERKQVWAQIRKRLLG